MTDKQEQLIAKAAEALRAGQPMVARDYAERALAFDQASVPAHFLLGAACARSGNPAKAAECFERVLRADPNAYEAIVSLATVYRDLGRGAQSIDLFRRAVALRPDDAQAHNNLGRSLLATRSLDEAAQSFLRAIELQPKFPAPFHNLGKLRQMEGKDGDAATAFGQAASLLPSPENLLAYGQALLTLARFEDALEVALDCVQRFPKSASAHLLMCGVLTELGQFELAVSHLNDAIERDPEGLEALQTAVRQRPLGYIEEANANLRRAIAKNPRLVAAYDTLIQNHRVTESDRELVESLAALPCEDLSPTEQVSVHYGLGKAREDLGEYEPAMRHYDEANRVTRHLKFGDAPFDRERYLRHVDDLIKVTEGSIDKTSSLSEQPVLIIGMMRSGTSLAEQILSSHRDVAGAGERLFWSRNWRRAVSQPSLQLDLDVLAELGREYVAELTSFGKEALRVTDKMPGNYMFAGLIHRALPNARFIHVRRNPLDTCLSIWTTPNHMPHEGGHDKGDITFVYGQYLRLMEVWRKRLPSDRLLEVDYERMVAEPDTEIPRMVEFCGLEWDPACLSPEKNRRLVATPSAWQVRQPLYRTSIARWKKFEPWLAEFESLRTLAHPQF